MLFRVTLAGTFTNLFSFNGTNGQSPQAELTVGDDGNLYGTTQSGGAANFGTVFKATLAGNLTTLASFSSSQNGLPMTGLLLAGDGNFYGSGTAAIFRMTSSGLVTPVVSLYSLNGFLPESGLTLAPDGSFYGTTFDGGSNNLGTVFRVTPDGTFTSLFSFNGTNGASPQGALTFGTDGNLYGDTTTGGASQFGVVYRISTNGAQTVLASFNGTNGANPQCQLVADSNGNFYGTAPELGANMKGTIFRVTTDGVLTALASFNGTNGAFPEDGLTPGNDGNFYGTASGGGGPQEAGTVIRVTPGGALTVLAAFNNTNGILPLGALALASDGNFYGTTFEAGPNGGFGSGNIFKVTTNGVLTPLHFFDFTDGADPSSKMIEARDGSLYGMTGLGGSAANDPTLEGNGTIYRLTTNGVFTSLVDFQGTNGSKPGGPLVLGNDGNLYGTTSQGGPGGGGTIFRLVLQPLFTGITLTSSGNIVLTGTGLPQTPYRLWAASDLSTPFASWTLLTNGQSATDGSFTFTDNTPAPPTRYYRATTP